MKNRKRKNRTLLALLTTLMMVFSVMSLTAFAESSNEWMGDCAHDRNSFSHNFSEHYVYSDETTDYYQITEPYQFNFGEDGIEYMYTIAGSKNYCPAQLQNVDGSEVSGATIVDPLGPQRYVQITGLQAGTSYRLFWDAEQTTKLTKNVVLTFTTAGEAPVEPQDPTFALTSSEGDALKAKKNTTLTVDVENGNVEDYTYKFIVYNKTSEQWYKLRDFDATNTFDWYTGPGGEKTLYVDIKQGDEIIKREALEVNVAESTLKVDSFTIDPTGELATKTQAALSATASGGAGEYQYKFIVYNATSGQWYKLKDFGPESTFDWYTGPAGTKTLYVDVKDADGTVVRAPLDVTVA